MRYISRAQKVSVAICTYNGGRYLGEQLESIASQSWPPDEIVLFDDASQDHTLEVAHQFEMRLPISIYANTNRLGSTSNFAKAISACTGDVIFLCDQDDIWEPRKIEYLMKSLSGPDQPGMVFSDASLIDEKSHPLNTSVWKKNRFSLRKQIRFRREGALAHLLRSNIVTGATAAFRSDYLDAILPIPNGWIHDYWIATVVSCFAPIHCQPICLTRYRIHSAQQIGADKNAAVKAWELFSSRKDLTDEIRKYETLLQRIRSYHPRHAVLDRSHEQIARKINHLSVRKYDIACKTPNLAMLIREILNGNYSRFSYGWLDILSDGLASFSPRK